MWQGCLDERLTHEGKRSGFNLDIVDLGSQCDQLADAQRACHDEALLSSDG